MASIHVRARQPRDIPSVGRLLQSVYQSDGYPVEGVSDPVAWLLPDDCLYAWVAVRSPATKHESTEYKDIVGHVLVRKAAPDNDIVRALHQRNGKTDKQQFALLARLFVDDEYRGRGIAKQLIDIAETWAAENHLGLLLDVMRKDKVAVGLYQKLGWVCIGGEEHDNGSGQLFQADFFASPSTIQMRGFVQQQ